VSRADRQAVREVVLEGCSMKAQYILQACQAMQDAMDCKDVPVDLFCQLSKAKSELMAYSRIPEMEIEVENETH